METPVLYEERLRQGWQFVLREGTEFFARRGDVYETVRELARRLDEEQIGYALIGALALAEHGFARLTQDVGVLMAKDGLERFTQRCLGRGYLRAFPGAQKSFRAGETGVRVDVVTAGEYPGDGLPKPVSFPDPLSASEDRGGVRVLALTKLVELKLASGMTAPHRLRDLADVQDLIRSLQLGPDLAERLDPSVREVYLHLHGEAQGRDRVVES